MAQFWPRLSARRRQVSSGMLPDETFAHCISAAHFFVSAWHCLLPHPSGAPPFPAPQGARIRSHSDGDSRLAPRGSVGGVPLRACINGVPPRCGGADSGSVCIPTTPVHAKDCTSPSVFSLPCNGGLRFSRISYRCENQHFAWQKRNHWDTCGGARRKYL